MVNSKRKIIYSNQLSGLFKYQLGYTLLRFSPVFLIAYIILTYLNASMSNVLTLILLIIINIYRFKKFNFYHELMNTIEMVIDQKGITIVTTKADYHINQADILAVALVKIDKSPEDVDIYIQPREDVTVEWPKGLIEKHYLRLPMVFEDHALDVVEEWDFLKERCKNLQQIKSLVNY